MEIEKDCVHYLQSEEVIKIFQHENALLHNKVFDCLGRHKKYFYHIIPLTHQSLARDILFMCAEDAFNKAQEIFYRNVVDNKFAPVSEDCISYISVIFKRYYLQLYKKELQRKMFASDYAANKTPETTLNEGETRLEKLDFTSMIVRSVLADFSDEDKRIFHLHYVENLKVREIAGRLNLNQHTVSARLYNFHKRFNKMWMYKSSKQQ